jgi:hypothetical protein
MITLDGRDLAAHLRNQQGGVLAAVLDGLPDFFFIKDIDSRFLHCKAAHLWQLRVASLVEAIGKSEFEVYPPALAEVFTPTRPGSWPTGCPR